MNSVLQKVHRYRIPLIALLVIAAHVLDVLTFWVAVAVHDVPLSAEKNPWMAAVYAVGGYTLVFAAKMAFIALILAVMARIQNKPLMPAFSIVYGLGLLGATANVIVIMRVS